MIEYTDLQKEIDYWKNELATLQDVFPTIYEYAFLKIFIKFEVFVSKLFIYYCIGDNTLKYQPKRELHFNDSKHLTDSIKSITHKTYIDFLDVAENLSIHLFKKDDDPFSLIFNSCDYSNYYRKMKYLRNHIAHNSEESKRGFARAVLSQNSNQNITPEDFFRTINRKQHISNFTIFINKISEMAKILYNPTPYLKH